MEELLINMEGELVMILPANLKNFSSLLLPEVTNSIAKGEPVMAFGWVLEDTATAAIAGELEGDTLWINSFYVAPEYRNRGIGTTLLDVMEEAVQSLIIDLRMKLEMVATTEEHKEFIHFLTQHRFREREELYTALFRSTLKEAGEGKLGEMKESNKPGIHTLEEADIIMLRKAEKAALAKREPLPVNGFRGTNVMQDLSLVYEESGKILAYLILERKGDGGIIIASALNKSPKPMIIVRLFRDALQKCLEKFDPETELVIPVTDPVANGLVRMLIPKAEKISYTFERLPA